MIDIYTNILEADIRCVLESNDNFVRCHKKHFIFVQYTYPTLPQVLIFDTLRASSLKCFCSANR